MVLLVEASIVLSMAAVIALWLVRGFWKYGCDKQWDIEAFLKVINDNWKGALLLGGLMVLGPIRDFIQRLKSAEGPGFSVSAETPNKSIPNQAQLKHLPGSQA